MAFARRAKATDANQPVDLNTENGLPTLGRLDAPIVVVCDVPRRVDWNNRVPISDFGTFANQMGNFEKFRQHATANGFDADDFFFISPCAPFPKEVEVSEKRKSDFMATFRNEFLEIMSQTNPRVVVCMGNSAVRQYNGRPMQITKVRGVIQQVNDRAMMAMYSPAHVLRVPEVEDMFAADMGTLARLRDADFDANQLTVKATNYKWGTVSDLREIISQGPKTIAVDTEGTGLQWHRPEVFALTVQITTEEGNGFCFPVSTYYTERHADAFLAAGMSYSSRDVASIVAGIKTIMEDARWKKVGHNLKFDEHMMPKLGINSRGWLHDTQLLAFMADENMMKKSLDECVRRWVPEMSGYSDDFDRTVDKAQMIAVPPYDVLDAEGNVSQHGMLAYACGDTDATLRLMNALKPILKADPLHARRYTHVVMPAILTFAKHVEPHGMLIDHEHIAALERNIDDTIAETYSSLIAQVPAAVRRRHLDKGLEFSRADFLRDVLFSPDGLGLVPTVFTEVTKNLPPEQRVPSTSIKDHLPYFSDNTFVQEYTDYTKYQKLKTTYVTGFLDKYATNNVIHPSFSLHRTNTGRTSSDNPNGQNFPKRGKTPNTKKLIKSYRRIFIPRPGYLLIEADLSQAELRLAAWEAMDDTMIGIYARNGDIHTATAMSTMRIDAAQWEALTKDAKDQARFQSKAVNFGYVYGMGWRGFKVYAKTQYGVDYTDTQAEDSRTTYFDTYTNLPEWHERRRLEVRQNGYVRSLHGAIRHLPSINSTDPAVRAMAERQAINAPVQQFASDIGLTAMIRIARDCNPDILRPLGFIHDAIVLEVKEEYALECAAAVKWYMESCPFGDWFGIEPPLPIKSDVSLGRSFSDMEELKNLEAARPSWFNPLADNRKYWEIF